MWFGFKFNGGSLDYSSYIVTHVAFAVAQSEIVNAGFFFVNSAPSKNAVMTQNLTKKCIVYTKRSGVISFWRVSRVTSMHLAVNRLFTL